LSKVKFLRKIGTLLSKALTIKCSKPKLNSIGCRKGSSLYVLYQFVLVKERVLVENRAFEPPDKGEIRIKVFL